MKAIFTTITLLFLPLLFFAQSYNTALGLRMGTDWGLTLQQRLTKKLTIEGIIQSSMQREEVILTALLERHMALLTRRFNIYYGAGIHKGWVDDVYEDFTAEDPFGITVIGGAEFTIARLNISYDFKPALNIDGGEKRIYTQSGISVRYVLNKKKKFNKKRKKKRRKNSRINKNSSWKFWKKN